MENKEKRSVFSRISAAFQKDKQKVRLLFQALFFALTNGYAMGFAKGKIYTGANKQLCVPGLNCYSCPGALFACPIGSLQAVLSDRNFKMSCYVLGLIAGFGALFGRLICGWMCPFGLFQDLLHKIPLFKKAKVLPGHKWLKYTKYVVLGVFVLVLPSLIHDVTGAGSPWFCAYICPSGTLLGGIPLTIANPGLQGAIGFRFWWKVALLAAVTILSIKVYRPFCKYLCPLGALYGLCNPVSFYRLRVNKDACVECGACQKACGMDIPVWQQPNSMECIRCGKCKQVCPQHAITSTWEDWQSAILKKAEPSPADKDASLGVYEKKRTRRRKSLGGLTLGFQVLAVLIALYILQMLFSVLDGASSTMLDVLGTIAVLYLFLCSCIGMVQAGRRLMKNAGVRAKNREICATAIFSVLLAGVSCILMVLAGCPYPLFVFCLGVDALLCLLILFACRKGKQPVPAAEPQAEGK